MTTSEAVAVEQADATQDLAAAVNAAPKEPVLVQSKEERRGAGATPKAFRQAVEEEAVNVIDWARSITGGTAGFRVDLHRMEPVKHLGQDVGGFLMAYHDDPDISEERIKQEHGGGRYKLTALTPNEKGSWTFRKRLTISIAGAPKLIARNEDDRATAAAPASVASEQPSVATRALDMVEKAYNRGPDRGQGMDPVAIAKMVSDAVAAATAPLQRMNDALASEIREMRTTAPQTNPVADKLLERFIDKGDNRLDAIRMQHESELNQLRQSARDSEARLRDQFDRDRDRSDKLHDREVKQLTDAHARELQSLRDSHARELESAKSLVQTKDLVGASEQKRLNEEVVALRAEVKELRAKKDKSPLEMIKELNELKEIIGEDDGDEDKSSIEKVIDVITNSKAAIAVVKRLGGGDEPAAPPPGQPYQAQDGQWYVNGPDGQPRPLRRTKKKKQVAGAAAGTAAPAGEAPAQEDLAATLDRDQVDAAVKYLEAACRNNVEAATVTSSARSLGLVPSSVLRYLQVHGVDDLLTKVAGLEATSPLMTQAGRNWARKVAKGLTEG